MSAWRLEGFVSVLRLMDDKAGDMAGREWKSEWREFLRMGNVLQFVAGVSCVTSTGLREGLYGRLLDIAPKTTVTPGKLESLLASIFDEAARQIAKQVFDGGFVMPEPGYELAGADGEIVGVAELAWVEQKLCVLSEQQAEYSEAAQALAWTIFKTDELWEDPQKLLTLLPAREA
jgi:DEAD/DEAH box helicase domain-containing protein